MRYEVYYQQTPRERYDTAMNDHVEAVLLRHNLKVDGSFGGTWIGADDDDLASENGFIVETDGPLPESLRDEVEAITIRPIRITEIEPD